MNLRRKLILTFVGMVLVFGLAWSAMVIETLLHGRGIVKTVMFPSLELCGWFLRREGWLVVVAALIQYPLYAALFVFVWWHGQFWRGIAAVGIVHAVATGVALLIVWPYL